MLGDCKGLYFIHCKLKLKLIHFHFSWLALHVKVNNDLAVIFYKKKEETWPQEWQNKIKLAYLSASIPYLPALTATFRWKKKLNIYICYKVKETSSQTYDLVLFDVHYQVWIANASDIDKFSKDKKNVLKPCINGGSTLQDTSISRLPSHSRQACIMEFPVLYKLTTN